mgnify:CR=1 FL=1
MLFRSAAQELGKHLGRRGVTVTTTSSTGFPLWAAMAARRQGAVALAFSPAASQSEHEHVYQQDRAGYTNIIYTGFGTSGASVMGVRSSDAVVFGCGGMSSILELITAIQEGKPIGILEGAWPTDEVLADMLATQYPDYAHIMTHDDPAELAAMMVKQIGYNHGQA